MRPFQKRNRKVKRMKWNNDSPLSFVDDDLFDFEMTYESKIGEHEQVEEKVDRNFWTKGISIGRGHL